MTSRPAPHSLQRRGAMALLSVLLVQVSAPADAVSTASPGYSGFVTQQPGVYTTPPEVNVMFTLDDSGSMQSDSIPDFSLAGVSYTGILIDVDSSFYGGTRYADMWSKKSGYYTKEYYQSSSDIARYLRSSAGNPLYYNPRVLYLPWPTAADNAQRMPAADPTKVNVNPGDPTNTGYQIDITQRVGSAGDETVGFWPATWYVYKGATAMAYATPHDPNNVVGNFVAGKFEITDDTTKTFPKLVNDGGLVSDRTDCTGAIGATGCTRAQELQNFANWLQYYRSRRLMAKGGVGAAFAKQSDNLRVGFARISGNPVVRRGVRIFNGTDRAEFFTKLYTEASADGLTPLRAAMDEVGEYFQSTDVNNPWAYKPGTTLTPEYSCRRSFHILSTDGFWNSNQAPTAAARNNNDDLTGLFTPYKPDNTTRYAYTDDPGAGPFADPLVGRFTVDPFADANANTLSDVAAYYWREDLRTGLENRVVPSSRDPAFWQHLTTFTIGFGINGSGEVTRTSDGSKTVPAGTFPTMTPAHPLKVFEGTPWLANQQIRDWLVGNKVPLTWTTPANENVATGDDLIHASMVGRGRFFSATDPKTLSTGLAAALSEAADQPLDFAAVAADSPQVRAGGNVYQATFSPAKWYGRIYAFKQDANGAVNNKPTDSSTTNLNQVWEVSNKMPAPNLRNIFTSSGTVGSGATFTWTSGLTSSQQADLGNDTLLLDFLRGDGSNEAANGGTFRDRSRYTVDNVTGGVLGDVVGGSPIKGPDFGGSYDRLPTGSASGQASYAAYRTGSGLNNLRATLFSAANDGMAHAFNVADGVERFAYVPNMVYNVPRSTLAGAAEQKLRLLADPGYTHRFTVDGPPNVSDAFLGGAWKTLMFGSAGAGARGLYMMDVTDPAVGTTGFGKGKIMWEFSEANNADMGFVLSYPHVAQMRNGKWGVILGNGYDSTNGQAKLFILDAETGAVMREFAVGAAGDNGLSQPNFVLNDNREVMAIYAGDLKGNLWKFDVSNTSEGAWANPFGSAPLITVANGADGVQPISAMPEIVADSGNGGVMLLFGTGKLFEASDTAPTASTPPNVNLGVQSIYGIWDKPGETAGITMNGASRSTVLQSQTITGTSGNFSQSSTNMVDVSSKRGWYLDLAANGERANLPPQQVQKTLFIVANTPTTVPCANGGCARIFALSPLTGAAPAFSVFDADNNGQINSADLGSNILKDCSGLLTQPLFQVRGTSVSVLNPDGTTTVSIQPPVISDPGPSPPVFDRGQVTSRPGGVEPLRSTPPGPCDLEMTVARSDTALLQTPVNVCAGARISWRQLK